MEEEEEDGGAREEETKNNNSKKTNNECFSHCAEFHILHINDTNYMQD